MSMRARMEYLSKQVVRYARRKGKGKSALIDEVVAVTGFTRKHAIKVLSGKVPIAGKRGARRGGRGAHYGEPEARVLRELWRATNYLCSQRLASALETWLPFCEKRSGGIEEKVRANLESISASSIERLLRPWKAKEGRSRRCTTRPGTLSKLIEIRTGSGDIKEPGHIEADTVAHCGGSMAGDYVYSLTATDIWTGWTEMRAFWNKGREETLLAMKDMEASLPFALRSFDSDNGTEFINYHLYDYFAGRKEPVRFTRSRAYQKNDQAHVEQKNWVNVRQLVGYDRLPHIEQARLLNELYRRHCSLFNNLFLPSMKCVGIERRPGRKPRRIYDKATTPLERLARCPEADPAVVARLRALRDSTDPFALAKTIRRKIDAILALKPKP